MGMVFGIQREEEPAYEVVLDRNEIYRKQVGVVPYEIRRYGTRFAIEAAFDDPEENANNESKDDGTRSPFMKLAGYIGVMSEPQNEGKEGIAMTAPVAMQGGDDKKKKDKKKGEKINMTAPVAMHREGDTAEAGDAEATGHRKMQFFLPSKYDSLDKIPSPTNPDVTIKTVPPAFGAVHRYSGKFSESISRAKARSLVETLLKDGAEVGINLALNDYEFWGYNPPFTIPAFRRNEVWVELSEAQVELLTKKYGGSAEMDAEKE